ncbi:MAG: F0F1 ATP synthase subunit A [Proteobacteria bacterium]|nr:F0F1 ATP synthase subunit A [Desulfobacteraceae bacterium]MBU4002380.1 F0F1 ATP synthase subunit A [Pseudomonadota bacterium]MBU4317371.1 F0F1 ATP synthase subunit A [Pseudomonadota bacterium]MBU4469972.1 F0F1 ATP synthase subunit A [Pseudomonadota bacterium]MCG2753734.1 F0F1 ATP synthase subunit A [Desulfobacteraceae bacterium]
MEHPYLFLTKLFELFGLGDFASAYPHVVYSWLVMTVLIVFGFLASKGMSMVPSKVQNVFEIVVSGLDDFIVENIGEEGRLFFPILATIFLYVLLGNLFGLLPGFFPPTSNINTPLSCALVVFVMTHLIGIKYHGVGYIKHFMGAVWWMSPLFLIIELIGHSARVLSLTFRLFGNMMGHELVLGILFSLGGMFLLPLPIMTLGILVAVVQAFVFFMLSMMYFSGAMEHAH